MVSSLIERLYRITLLCVPYEPYGGTPGPINPWLSHKVYSAVNITPTLSMKAIIDYSHHELHGDIHINFF